MGSYLVYALSEQVNEWLSKLNAKLDSDWIRLT